ncbi:MAG: hypothetical protein KAU95_01095, partial [Candidatus Aenigmarchaeota archaeon]|nr:hypothetical protein [Candidatus Aenigmarchaeota archaeon]
SNFHQNFGKKLNFEFTTPTDLADYKICARTFSGSGEKLDEICHLISAEKEMAQPTQSDNQLYIFILILIIVVVIFVYLVKRK